MSKKPRQKYLNRNVQPFSHAEIKNLFFLRGPSKFNPTEFD